MKSRWTLVTHDRAQLESRLREIESSITGADSYMAVHRELEETRAALDMQSAAASLQHAINRSHI